MRRIIVLCVFCLMAMGCETEPLTFGFKPPAQHLSVGMTGVSCSWPVLIGLGAAVWLVAKLTSRKGKDA